MFLSQTQLQASIPVLGCFSCVPGGGWGAHGLRLVPDKGPAVEDLDPRAELLRAALASPGNHAVVGHALNVIAQRIADLQLQHMLLHVRQSFELQLLLMVRSRGD